MGFFHSYDILLLVQRKKNKNFLLNYNDYQTKKNMNNSGQCLMNHYAKEEKTNNECLKLMLRFDGDDLRQKKKYSKKTLIINPLFVSVFVWLAFRIPSSIY